MIMLVLMKKKKFASSPVVVKSKVDGALYSGYEKGI